MDTQTIIMTVTSGLLGGGLIAFIQFLITRHDRKHDRFKEVTDAIRDLAAEEEKRFQTLDRKIDTVEAKADEYNAISCRVRILRFRDEMLAGQNHTHDSFQQVLGDIDGYERFCEQHPDFRNNQTFATVEHIKQNYHERLEKHDFL